MSLEAQGPLASKVSRFPDPHGGSGPGRWLSQMRHWGLRAPLTAYGLHLGPVGASGLVSRVV
eukprot:9483817-Pyramimonas_sp.AAC.2